MTRPGFVDGVCLVANAVADVTFRVDAEQVGIDAALVRLAGHDRRASLAPGSRRVIGADASNDGGLVAAVGPATGDWLDGYAAALAALADVVPLEAGPVRPEVVAIVGMRVDRREGDRAGDLAEVARWLEALGLVACPPWPSPVGVAGLSPVARAGTLVAMPYGREAARRLAKRTGAIVVDSGLPVGLAGTSAWVRQIADATGTREAAEAFLASELDRAAPRLEWVVPHMLLHRRLCLGGDGPWVAAWADAFGEVGCRVVGALVTAGTLPEGSGLPVVDAVPGPDVADLVVGDHACVEAARQVGTPALERGYPNLGEHFVTARPTLGILGFLGEVEAVVNRLSLESVVQEWRHPGPGPAGLRSPPSRRDVR
jgi:nitrogenase molybdenum-iron protein alpha/beta subunit